MTLPKWYVETAEDYLSILRSAQEYSQSELFEATRNQRLAEYKLMKEKNSNMPVPPPKPLPLNFLRQYDKSDMLRGHFQMDRPKQIGTRGFWENVLK